MAHSMVCLGACTICAFNEILIQFGLVFFIVFGLFSTCLSTSFPIFLFLDFHFVVEYV